MSQQTPQTACILYTDEQVTETSRILLEIRDTFTNDSMTEEDRRKYTAINIALDAVGRMPTVESYNQRG